MPSATDRFALHRPAGADPADVPTDLETLTDQLDDRLAYAGAQGGKSIVPDEQSRTNTAYGLLGSPDRVQNLVVPDDALVCVAFDALWKESVNGAARAALFIGANQIKTRVKGYGTDPVTQAAIMAGTANTYSPLTTFPLGLLGLSHGGIAYGSSVTTGQSLGQAGASLVYELGGAPGTASSEISGGGIWIGFAAAGTYDVSVQFKSSSGSVTVKDRHLWVWTKEFPASGV